MLDKLYSIIVAMEAYCLHRQLVYMQNIIPIKFQNIATFTCADPPLSQPKHSHVDEL